METLGTTKRTVIKIEELHAINKSFVTSADVVRGKMVKFNPATGEVEPIAAVADVPFGMVTAGAKAGERPTIQVPFSAVMYATADGAIVAGDRLSASGLAAGDFAETFKKSVLGNTIVAVALEDAADTEPVLVGLYRTYSIQG